MGFSPDQATAALRQSDGNVQGAIHSLLSNGTETGPPPPAASHPYPHGGGGGPVGRGGDSGRGRGVGRGTGHDNREHRPGAMDRGGEKPDKGTKSQTLTLHSNITLEIVRFIHGYQHFRLVKPPLFSGHSLAKLH